MKLCKIFIYIIDLLLQTNDFRVVLIARNQDSLNEYVQELSTEGIEAHAQAADASSTESLTKAFKQITEKYGTIDVLVYNEYLLSI